MRSSWNGNLKLGTLVVPVKLYSAVRSVGPRFVQLHAVDHTPITRQLICQKDGEEVQPKDIVRAAEYDGQMVELSDDDLQVDGTGDKSLSIRQFSEPCDIDPVYYDKPYYVIPAEGGEFGYTLLRQAFVKAKKIAIATYMLYEKQHIGIITATEGLLRLQQLRYTDEVVAPKDLPTRSLTLPAPGQVDAAVELMQRYSTEFYLSDYRNEQVDVLKKLIERRAKGLRTESRSTKRLEATAERDVLKVIRELASEPGKRALHGSM